MSVKLNKNSGIIKVGKYYACYNEKEYFDPSGQEIPAQMEKKNCFNESMRIRDPLLSKQWCLYYLLERQEGTMILTILFDDKRFNKFLSNIKV